MQEFYFLQFIAKELEVTLDDLTNKCNVFIKELHMEPGKTVIKYEILSKDGFFEREAVFFNDIKK